MELKVWVLITRVAGSREMAQLSKHLMYKQEDVSLILRTHVKSQVCWCVLVILVRVRWEVETGGCLELTGCLA